MHARIRAPGSSYLDGSAVDPKQNLLEEPLNRCKTRLDLPTVVGRSLVLEDQLEPAHRRAPCSPRMTLKNPLTPRLLKKVQMSRAIAGRRAGYPSAGWAPIKMGTRCEAYLLRTPQRVSERAGYPSVGWVPADGPFSAACLALFERSGRQATKQVVAKENGQGERRRHHQKRGRAQCAPVDL